MKTLSDVQFAMLVIIPVIVFNLAVIGYPLAYSFWMSFESFKIGGGPIGWVGLQNYASSLRDPNFLYSLSLTMDFSIFSTVLTFLLGFFYALLLNESFRGASLLKVIILLPWAVSEFAAGIIYKLILSPTYGFLNAYLFLLGLIPSYVSWLSSEQALNWIGVVFAWHYAPLGAFFMFAALQTVPEDLYRAAKVDGAGPIRRFINVTYPFMRYAILITLVVNTAYALQEFDLIYVMTRGGPGVATEIATMHIYRQNFYFYSYGPAAARSWFLTLIVLVIATVYFYLLSRRS